MDFIRLHFLRKKHFKIASTWIPSIKDDGNSVERKCKSFVDTRIQINHSPQMGLINWLSSETFRRRWFYRLIYIKNCRKEYYLHYKM